MLSCETHLTTLENSERRKSVETRHLLTGHESTPHSGALPPMDLRMNTIVITSHLLRLRDLQLLCPQQARLCCYFGASQQPPNSQVISPC